MSVPHIIPFGRPMIGPEEQAAVARVLAGPQLVHGPMAHEFEQRFAARAGVAHAITVSSCTAGLHLALHVHGIGPGDEVIVPAMTHVATAHAVEYCRARPVFVDVDPASGNLDLAAVEAAIGPRTKAVMVVYFLGLPPDMTRLRAIAQKTGLLVVEDAALALDASYDGVKAGRLGDVASFSFYPTKHMTTSEGGMVTTGDAEIARRIAAMKAFGYDKMVGERTRPGIYDVNALGFNYRMSELHAAIGLAQLEKLDQFQAARAANFKALREDLADCAEITVFAPEQGKGRSSHYCLNAILPRDGSILRDEIVEQLKAEGIGTSVHYPSAVPLFSYYREKYGYRVGQFPVAEWLAGGTISLPVGPHLEPGDPASIAAALKAVLAASVKAPPAASQRKGRQR
ncbi:MAG: DegT/DnrJ/EryC1/StrS aminotransferase family protein [Alphaproteobacteria bacterium]|nr:DegT/DnrJ/EryC1/StrS aminotransferase family protein [Alphaproteobacteria bacterium]